jgi:urease accessory protein
MKISWNYLPWLRWVTLVGAVSTPFLAGAHPALPGHTHGLVNGLLHPLTGWDHLLAMTAVGFLAARSGSRATWLLPLTFLSAMMLGGMLGMAAGVPVPMIEQGIAASVLILGIFIAAPARLPTVAGAWLVGLFALFHGYSHGAEMPASASGWLYGAGFILATASLHLLGIGLGRATLSLNSLTPVRIAGCLMALGGVYLLVQA